MSIKQDPNRLDFYIEQPDKKPRIRKKRCTMCKELKSITKFNTHHTSNDGLAFICKPCCNNTTKKWEIIKKNKNKNKSNKEIYHENLIKCIGVCGSKFIEIKTHYLYATKENFDRNNGRKSGLSNRCKKCKRIATIQKKYNIPYFQYDEMYKNQEGKCLICKKNYDVLLVDHDHKTGKVRALLCIKCNTRIGHLEDKNFIKKGILYLKKYDSNIEHLKGEKNSF